jgi:hypothetical protein
VADRVRRQDHPERVAFEERVVHVDRLLLEHVERRAGDPAAVDRLGQRRLVDNAPARGVDHDCRRLHQAELAPADQPQRLGGARRVDRDHVRGRQQRLEGHRPRDVRVVRLDRHLPALEALLDGAGDPAVGDQADRLAPQQRRGGRRPPLAGPDRRLLALELQEQRHHEHDRRLGHADDDRVRRAVGDQDAERGRRLDVDVVDPDDRAADHPEARRRAEHLGRERLGRLRDDRVRFAEEGGDLVRRPLAALAPLELDDVVAGGPQPPVQPGDRRKLGRHHHLRSHRLQCDHPPGSIPPAPPDAGGCSM